MDPEEVINQEENESSSIRDRPVYFRVSSDLLISHFCNLHLFFDFSGDYLGLLQIFDQLQVLKDITFLFRKLTEKLIFKVHQLNLVLIVLLDQFFFLSCQIRSFFLDNQC